MNQPLPEVSRAVPLSRLGAAPYRVEIAADAEERERLARRFDLLQLDRLVAAVTLRRLEDGRIRLEARFEAEFVQSCVVTLDPVPGRVAAEFALIYGESEDDGEDIDSDPDAPAFEPLSGEVIDVGEAVAQELSLALPEFPRLPDATVEALGGSEAESTPFAALERVRSRRDE